MNESEVAIKLDEETNIYGTLNSENNGSLIIFVHGLTGSPNTHMHYNAARFFPKNNFDTFRFSLYPGREKSKCLHESTITSHAEFINTVVSYFKDAYKKIFLVGHSLGGPSILMSNQDVTATTLWDPSYCLDVLFEDTIIKDKENNLVYTDWGTWTLLGAEMLDELENIQKQLLSSFKKPTKLIFAGEGILEDMWKDDLKNIPVEYEVHTIKEATHCFDEWGTEEELFAQTLKFFNQF